MERLGRRIGAGLVPGDRCSVSGRCFGNGEDTPLEDLGGGAELALVRGAADTPRDRRRSVRRARSSARPPPSESGPSTAPAAASCWPRTGIARPHSVPSHPRAAQGANHGEQQRVALALSLRLRELPGGSTCAGTRCPRAAPARNRPAVRRELLAAAVAAASPRVRLPTGGALGAETSPASRSASSSSCLRKGSISIWSTECSSRLGMKSTSSTSSCCRRAPSTRAISTSSRRCCPPRCDRSHHRGPRAADATRPTPGQLGAHRRG